MAVICTAVCSGGLSAEITSGTYGALDLTNFLATSTGSRSNGTTTRLAAFTHTSSNLHQWQIDVRYATKGDLKMLSLNY